MNPCVNEPKQIETGAGEQKSTYSLSDLLRDRQNDLTDGDLAVLADWANAEKQNTRNDDWKRAYALIREGADLLLRRRARSRTELNPSSIAGTNPDYLDLRIQLKDFSSTLYGPHSCPDCGVLIVKRAYEDGGQAWTYPGIKAKGVYFPHTCKQPENPSGSIGKREQSDMLKIDGKEYL